VVESEWGLEQVQVLVQVLVQVVEQAQVKALVKVLAQVQVQDQAQVRVGSWEWVLLETLMVGSSTL